MQGSAIPEHITKDPQLLSRHDRDGDAKVKETVIEVRVVSEGGKRGVVEFRLPDDRVAAAAVHIRREAWEKPAGD
jgi:hypothetical protein